MEKKILIVDDDITHLKLLEKILLSAGFSVAIAMDGKEAIVIAREWNPALILLDIMMPGMDGGETAEALEKNPRTKDIPILFLTSLVTKKEEGKRKSLLGRNFMAKPFNPDELLKEIKKYL